MYIIASLVHCVTTLCPISIIHWPEAFVAKESIWHLLLALYSPQYRLYFKQYLHFPD